MSRKRFKFRKEDEAAVDGSVEKKEQDKEEYDAFSFMKDKKQTAAVAGAFFIVGFLASWFMAPSMTGQVIQSQVPADINKIGNDGVAFLNEYFVEEGQVTLSSVADQGELIEVTTSYNGNDIPVYMTKDGKFIILGGIGAINMEDYAEQAAQAAEQPAEPEAPAVPKADKPVVNLYVMSYCPYGLQMEKAILPVMELLGDKADINIDYVGYIMHGEKEMVQNNRQHCIENDQPDKFIDYMTCFVQSDDHAKCTAEAAINTQKLDTCLADLEDEFNVTNVFRSSTAQFPPYPVVMEAADQYGVRGSPTMIINGQQASVSRSPEAVKQAICNAFTTAPEECSSVLSTSQEGPGIGAMGSGTTSGSAGTCG